MEEKITTHSQEQTQSLSQKILSSGFSVVTFKGNLGAGKTTLIQGIGKELGLSRLTSPTFTVIRQYDLKSNHSFPFTHLYHIDLYRLTSKEEALDLGLEELWSDPQNLILIEWPEIVETILPKHLKVKIKITGPDQRDISITD